MITNLPLGHHDDQEPELLNLLRHKIRSIESHGIDPRLTHDIKTIDTQERHFSHHADADE